MSERAIKGVLAQRRMFKKAVSQGPATKQMLWIIPSSLLVLLAKLRRMEEALKQSEARPVRRAHDDESTQAEASIARQVNLAGTWRDRIGVPWIIQQTGNAVAFQEYNPILAVTAVGQGTVSGHQLQLTHQSALPTNGQAN